MSEADAGVNGVCDPRFARLADQFATHFAEGRELGASLALCVGDEVLVNIWAGTRSRDQSESWTEDTIAPVYSTTKPVAILVLAWLVSQGRLNLSAPIRNLWPEFAAYGKGDLTIAQVLSHQAGVPGFAEPIDPDLWLDPPGLAAAIANLPPMWAPGTASGYHPLTFGYIAGELARRADARGRTLGTILREEFCGPAGIDFQIGLPEADDARLADMRRPSQLPDLGELTPPRIAAFLTKWASAPRDSAQWRRVEIPSANGHGNALSVARLYGLYAQQGRLGTKQLIAPEVIADIAALQIENDDLVLPYHLQWGIGVIRNHAGQFGPETKALAHAGWGGSFGLADPVRGFSLAYVMNRQSNQLMGDDRARALIHTAYACLG